MIRSLLHKIWEAGMGDKNVVQKVHSPRGKVYSLDRLIKKFLAYRKPGSTLPVIPSQSPS